MTEQEQEELERLARELAPCWDCCGKGYHEGDSETPDDPCGTCDETGSYECFQETRLRQLLDQHKQEVQAAYERGRAEARWVDYGQGTSLYCSDKVLASIRCDRGTEGYEAHVYHRGGPVTEFWGESEARRWVESQCEQTKTEEQSSVKRVCSRCGDELQPWQTRCDDEGATGATVHFICGGVPVETQCEKGDQ